MYRRYYSYNDMPSVANNQGESGNCGQPPSAPPFAQMPEPHGPPPPPDGGCEKGGGDGLLGGLMPNGKILGRFEIDDVLLLIVIFVLMMDDCDDNLLLIVLGVVFFSGMI